MDSVSKDSVEIMIISASTICRYAKSEESKEAYQEGARMMLRFLRDNPNYVLEIDGEYKENQLIPSISNYV